MEPTHETPYQTLKRRGSSIVEIPTSLKTEGSADDAIYIAEVSCDAEIRSELQLVIPRERHRLLSRPKHLKIAEILMTAHKRFQAR